MVNIESYTTKTITKSSPNVPNLSIDYSKLTLNNNPINTNLCSKDDIEKDLSEFLEDFNETNMDNISNTNFATDELQGSIKNEGNELPEKKAWYEKLWDGVKSTGATIATGATSVVSGIADIGEAVVDGLTWTGGKVVEGTSWLVGKTAGLIDEDAENDIMNWREDFKSGTQDFISTDWVGNANKAFYEGTRLGAAINDASYMKYDSELAKKIASSSEMVGKIAVATGATVLTGGAAAPIAAGFLFGVGNKSEKVYGSGKATGAKDELGILISGAGEAANWYALGKLGQGATQLAKATKANGVKATASSVYQALKTTIGNIKANGVINTAKGMFSKEQMLSNFKKSISGGGNIASSVGIVGDNVSDWITGEEEFNFKNASSAFGELLLASSLNWTLDSATDYIGALNDVSGITIGSIDDVVDDVVIDSPDASPYIEETALFDGSSDKRSFVDKMFGKSYNPPKPQLSTQERILRDRINEAIRQRGEVLISFNNTTEFSTALLENVDDLSKLNVRINGGFNDLNGNYRPKYNAQRYIDRVTYSGYETLAISRRLDELASMIDTSLPVAERAKQIYEVLASEVPVMRDFNEYADGHKISASLRGLTDVNSLGRQGLVCAGYAQAYKELCTRCGITCDYIRGIGYDDVIRAGGSGGHAWNVIVDGDNYIPVDVTWKACHNDENWFGGSYEFEERHVADADEFFKDFSAPKTNKSAFGDIEKALSLHDAKYQNGDAFDRLKKYINTGNINYISSTGGARDIIKNTPMSELQNYVRVRQEKESLSYIISVMSNKYGYKSTMTNLSKYLETQDPTFITRTGGARDLIASISPDTIRESLKEVK